VQSGHELNIKKFIVFFVIILTHVYFKRPSVVRAITIFIFASLLSAVSGYTHAQLRTYSFTADFVGCVKGYASELDDFTVPGVADSSLMNGRTVITGGTELNGDYWNYMDCLSKARGGTTNEALATAIRCPAIDVSLGGKKLSINSGREGKNIGVSGYFWRCTGGAWVRAAGIERDPIDGNENIDTPDTRTSCDSVVKTDVDGNCSFNLGSTTHGRVVEDFFGPKFGDEAEFQGYGRYVCQGGSYQAVSVRCTPSACQAGTPVSWVGVSDGLGSIISRCDGLVDEVGFARQSNVPKTYYPSLIEAKLRTVSTSGSAQFACHDSEWVLPKTNPVKACSRKPSSELECGTIVIDGIKELYFCE
jgi:hypothetical protein